MGQVSNMIDGKNVWRNFKDFQLIYPDGQVSRPQKFDGLVQLRSGKDKQDRLEFLFKTTPFADRVVIAVRGFAFGFLSSEFIRIAFLS